MLSLLKVNLMKVLSVIELSCSFFGSTMKKTLIILAAIGMTQLTACAHRSYVSESSYNTRYPSTYSSQNQYDPNGYEGYQNAQRNPQYERRNDDRYEQYQQTEVAQIISMRNVGQARQSNSNGGGAVVGAILGGIIGNQLGRGDDNHVNNRRNRNYNQANSGDRAAATIGGALIGGMIGNAVENSNDDRSDYRQSGTEIALRTNNGQVHNVIVENPGHLRTGDRVRITYQQGRIIIL
jgi:outer membrane lipoprotein SlyB